jgi:hypothetical protein
VGEKGDLGSVVQVELGEYRRHVCFHRGRPGRSALVGGTLGIKAAGIVLLSLVMA